MRNHLLLILLFFMGVAKAQIPADTFAVKAMGFAKKGDYNQAILLYDQAIRLKPDTHAYYYHKAYCYFNKGEYQKATDVVSEIEGRFSNQYNAVISNWYFYNAMKNFQRSLDVINEAIKNLTSEPLINRIWLYSCRARTYYDLRRFKEALADYKRAYNMDTTRPEPITNFANVYDELNMPDSATYYYIKALSKEPANLLIKVNLGFFYNKIQKYDEAIALDEEVEKAFKKDKKGFLEEYGHQLYGLLNSNYGFALYKKGKYKKALKKLNMGVAYYPSNSYVYKNRALVWIALNKTENACKDLSWAQGWSFTQQYGPEVDKLIEQYCK